MYGHKYSKKSMDQPGKVANPARGQLNRENEYFPIRARACEFGLARRGSAVPSPVSLLMSTLKRNIVLTGFLPSSAAASIYLF